MEKVICRVLISSFEPSHPHILVFLVQRHHNLPDAYLPGINIVSISSCSVPTANSRGCILHVLALFRAQPSQKHDFCSSRSKNVLDTVDNPWTSNLEKKIPPYPSQSLPIIFWPTFEPIKTKYITMWYHKHNVESCHKSVDNMSLRKRTDDEDSCSSQPMPTKYLEFRPVPQDAK